MTDPFRRLRHLPAFWIASGGGIGLAPVAPGTFGTLLALLPWLALRHLPLWAYLAVILGAFAVGVWAANRVIAVLGEEDPGVVVWDEFIGLWITLTLVPTGWQWPLLGFALFRLFDIWKPWPVSWADQKIKGGFGAMLDDALAGLFALAVLQGVVWLV